MIKKIKPEEINRQIYNDNKYKILVKNNNIVSENEGQQRHLKEANMYKLYEKEKKQRIKEAKKKKVSVRSLDKMEQLQQIDKYVTFS